MYVHATVLGELEDTRSYKEAERDGNDKIDRTLNGYWCLERCE